MKWEVQRRLFPFSSSLLFGQLLHLRDSHEMVWYIPPPNFMKWEVQRRLFPFFSLLIFGQLLPHRESQEIVRYILPPLMKWEEQRRLFPISFSLLFGQLLPLRESQEMVRYTDDLYGRVGRNLGRAFWDYYKVTFSYFTSLWLLFGNF